MTLTLKCDKCDFEGTLGQFGDTYRENGDYCIKCYILSELEELDKEITKCCQTLAQANDQMIALSDKKGDAQKKLGEFLQSLSLQTNSPIKRSLRRRCPKCAHCKDNLDWVWCAKCARDTIEELA